MSSRRSALNLIYNRSTVRRFKPAPISDEMVQLMVENGQRAPTYCSFQAYSFILVKDEEKKKAIAQMHAEEAVLDASIWVVICADLNRLEKTLDILGHDHALKRNSFTAGKVLSIFDAALAAENMVLTAESLGLGSVFLSIVEEAAEVSRILRLPRGVLPIALLCIGEPDERPPRRPRLPLEVVLHTDEYRETSKEELFSYLKGADETLKLENYYVKYTGGQYSHAMHLKLKTQHSRERNKWNSALTKFIRRAGFGI
ncbi:MAG: nitroreductase family protein [Nitrososphaeria archaeon]